MIRSELTSRWSEDFSKMFSRSLLATIDVLSIYLLIGNDLASDTAIQREALKCN